MSKWEKSIPAFEELFLLYGELEPNHFEKIKKACFEAKKSEESANTQLAGHIVEEYKMTSIEDSTRQYIYSVLCDSHLLVDELNDRKAAINHSLLPGAKYKFSLDDVWCNFQKKHEFNPVHLHGGVISFIVFVNIPYNIDDELSYFSGKDESQSQASCLGFVKTLPNGSITPTPIHVDKSFEGKILAFPSSTLHYVNPFFTSDDYRITVSGNVRCELLSS